MKKLDDSALLVARVLMPILFIVAGYGKMGAGYAGIQQHMAGMGVPGFLLPLTILLEVGGGLAVLFGLLTRSEALVTVVFTLLTAFIFPWGFCPGSQPDQLYEKPDHRRWLSAAGGERIRRLQPGSPAE